MLKLRKWAMVEKDKQSALLRQLRSASAAMTGAGQLRP
jgi:hypothetical protein